MVQTRHQQATTSSAQSDPPAPMKQPHRYATRSASRAESSDLQHQGGDCGDDATSAPSRSAPPPSSKAGGRVRANNKGKGGARADDAEPRTGRRKAAPALAPVVEEAQEQEEEEEDVSVSGDESGSDGGGSGSGDEDDDDDEEAAMLQSLAASIAAAFTQKKNKPAAAAGAGAGGAAAPAAAAPAAAAAAAAARDRDSGGISSSEGESDDDDGDDDTNPNINNKQKVGLWQPSTGLKPAPPASRVALSQLGPATPAGVTAAKARAAPLDPKAAREAQKAAQQRRDTAGPRWYDLPATAITDDVKRELRLLRLRGAYDPKRFYRSYDGGRFPRYFAVATVEDDPLESAASRLSRKERRRATITEQLLADAHLSDARKRRFGRLQDEAARLAGMGKSGERGVLAAANKRQRQSSNPRLKKSHHRPKH